MKVLLVLISSLLIACGSDTEVIREVTKVEQVLKTEKISQTFEGFYHCEHQGFLELVQDSGDLVTALHFNLNSINPKNGTLGTYPVLRIRQARVSSDGLLRVLAVNYNYNSGHDIEQDESGANITGKRRTDLIVKKLDTGVLVTVLIYEGAVNDNINRVISSRSVECFE